MEVVESGSSTISHHKTKTPFSRAFLFWYTTVMPSFSYTVTPITDTSMIETLLGKSSHYEDFLYEYERDTIELLVRNFALPDSLYLMVTDDETFVGFVSCDRDWWEDNRFFLREIFVAPEYQGKGVGSYLMERCITHAKAHAAMELVTQTAFENIPMQQLCEKNGFVRWPNPQWSEGITYKFGFKSHFN